MKLFAIVAVAIVLAAPAYGEESMASHESIGQSPQRGSDRGGNSADTSAPVDNGMTDADYQRNQDMIDNDEVDTSVDSCAGGCLTPDDIDPGE